ncbi:hypothetical protein NGR_c05890 [Sinorhizobium fredii NGR234]|uniref:Uncharacterized protein n=1 Tax=Sinorhizobium fredii (strain NBRC 101917 / NGR234) TaxID=394 RepID=C3MI34_SINFN|nr:hypothetical protein [Sinorhizobium fredii]ACP24382.1 hypothetical protein NGR_c05890 [Sinorhizobium fredii NGR234]
MFPGTHRFQGCANGFVIDFYAWDRNCLQSPSLEMVEEFGFVLQPTFLEDLQQGIPSSGFGQRALGDLEIKIRQMAAVEMANQIMRAEDDLSADSLHVSTVSGIMRAV